MTNIHAMRDHVLEFVLIAAVSCGSLVWGLTGIRKRRSNLRTKELRQIDYILSIGQLAAGVIGISFLFFYWLKWG
jgi:hypothetical protein